MIEVFMHTKIIIIKIKNQIQEVDQNLIVLNKLLNKWNIEKIFKIYKIKYKFKVTLMIKIKLTINLKENILTMIKNLEIKIIKIIEYD